MGTPDFARDSLEAIYNAGHNILGVVTNMCVISNVAVFQARFPNAQMIVDPTLCDSFDKEMHQKAIDVMRSMQVKIIDG